MDQEKDQTICNLTAAESGAGAISSNKVEKISNRNKGKRYPLLSFHELSGNMKDNEYILNYYRSDWPLKIAFLSLFQWHNETLNVWTQFPSSAETNISNRFSLGTTRLIDLKQESSLKTDRTTPEKATANWPFYVFLCGSIFYLLCSSICYLFCCQSRRLNTLTTPNGLRGNHNHNTHLLFPSNILHFSVHPSLANSIPHRYNNHGNMHYHHHAHSGSLISEMSFLSRVSFCIHGFVGLIPAVYATVANWNDPRRNVILAYESAMALSYLIGTMFYLSRVPERWKPGWFDLDDQSHQIFHVFVVMGALAHYGAADIFLRERSRIRNEDYCIHMLYHDL